MKILITGSEGLIGKIISTELEKEHQLIRLDRKLGIDILSSNISPYFSGIETLIHLAANPDPFINEKEAGKNIEIARRVIEACDNSKNLKRIINASSINVYEYIRIFLSRKKLTDKTPLSPNTCWNNGFYGRAKIEVERLFEEYCRSKRVSLLNLKIGGVTKDNLPPKQENGRIEPVDYDIHLKHQDLIAIIKIGLRYNGIGSYVCVSKKDGFIDESIRFLID